MSTVKTTNLQHPSASDVGITLGADGSVVLPQGFTGGVGSNVVQTVKTDTFTSTSATFVGITGMTATITPTTNTSKILVIVQLSHALGNFAGYGHFKITGGNTSGYVGSGAISNRIAAVFGGISSTTQLNLVSEPIVFLDSPATTSATTYTVECRTSGSGSVHINRSEDDSDASTRTRGASSITVIEVAV